MVDQIGAYRVTGELGRGGMGVVFSGQAPDGRDVAIKVLAEGAPSPSLLARFEREARACATLAHPSIVEHLDSGVTQGYPFLVFELLRGDSLKARLAKDGPLEAADAAELVAVLARAVSYVHAQGLLHRDLKPENVLFHHGLPKLTDFGLARDAREERERLTRTGQVLGTPAFMSPEQANGEAVGIATDLYGLGAILYATLTGQPPYSGKTAVNILTRLLKGPPRPPTALCPVPPGLEAICMRAMARDPADRYASADELAEALEDWSAAGGAPAPRRALPLLIGGALGAGCVALGVLAFTGLDPAPALPAEAPSTASAERAPSPPASTPAPKTEPAVQPPTKPSDPLAPAREAFAGQRWDQALAALDALDPKTREGFAALRLRGQVCLRLEAYRDLPEFLSRAHAALSKAVAQQRDASTVALLALCRQPGWSERSQEAARLGDGREPIALAAESMRLRVDMLEAKRAGDAHTMARLNAVRVDLLRRALAIDPRCFWARHQLPLALSGQRHDVGVDREAIIREALEAAREGVRVLPDVPLAHHRLGFVSKVASQDEQDGAGFALAIPHYDRALELDPSYVAARVDRGYARARAGLAGGVADLEAALQIAPYFPQALRVLDAILKAQDDLPNAQATWTRQIELAPDDFQRYVFRHEVWMATNDLGRAIADLEAALERCPRHLPQRPRIAQLISELRRGEHSR